MASQIARQTDLGSHGNVLTQGSQNVFESNLPVHRYLDLFVCPIHGVGVTMLNCSPRVLVNNRAVAHVGSVGIDKLPALVMKGSAKTFVGET